MTSPLLTLCGIPDGEESLPLEERSKEQLIDLITRLTEMIAQQSRIISQVKGVKHDGRQ